MSARFTRAGQKVRTSEAGFSLIQMLLVLVIATIVSTIAVISIQGARRSLRLSNSARLFASYLEKTRADSVRRRAQPGSQSSVQVLNNKTYRVTMDWGGGANLSSRDFNLESDVVFDSNPTTITFDWRGRPTTGTETTFAIRNGAGTTQVDVTGSGDVTVGSEVFQDSSIPNDNVNVNMSGTDDVVQDPPVPNASPTPTPSGTPTPNPTPTPTPDPSATPTPTPDPSPTTSPTPDPSPTPVPSPTATPVPSPTVTPTPPPCLPSVSPSYISIQKGGGTTTVSLTLSAGGTGDVTASGPPNLAITPTTRFMSPGQDGIFTIRSADNTRGEFTVKFSTPCGSTNLIVAVTN